MVSRISKPCKFCTSTSHYPTFCPRRPHKAIKTVKRISKRDKHFTKWMETRDKWFEQNKAPYYACYLCGKIMTRTQLTLDHIKSRARHPELRYKLSNLAPCCAACNQVKGSRDVSELENIKEYKERT